MPWPRRSKATSRNSSASALSYCFSQQRWFCDQPWMSRIGGPSALPHSRTWRRRPPPPFTVCVFIRPVGRCSAPGSATAAHLSPPRVRRYVRPIVATEARERIGRSALSFAAGLRIFRSRGSYERFPGGRSGAILAGWRRARARRSSDAYRSSRSSGARSTRHGREEARPSSSPEKRASARPGSRPSLRHAPATRGSTSDSGARSISSARTCRTSRSSRPCARSQTSVRSTGGRRARSCACSRRRWPCSRIARPRHPCCSCSRTCTGPTRRRSTSWSFSRTTSPTGRFSCSRPTARTSSRRRSACAALPTESGARARRSCSTWSRSRRRSCPRCSRRTPAPRHLRR